MTLSGVNGEGHPKQAHNPAPQLCVEHLELLL